jgi:hypothetical protein
MKITRLWLDDEQTIQYVRYLPGWNWDDHHHSISATLDERAARTDDPFVYVLVDMRGTRLPLKGSIMAQYRKFSPRTLVTIVTGDMFTHKMMQLGMQTRPDREVYRAARTIEEGQTIINAHRAGQQLPPVDFVKLLEAQTLLKTHS